MGFVERNRNSFRRLLHRPSAIAMKSFRYAHQDRERQYSRIMYGFFKVKLMVSLLVHVQISSFNTSNLHAVPLYLTRQQRLPQPLAKRVNKSNQSTVSSTEDLPGRRWSIRGLRLVVPRTGDIILPALRSRAQILYH